MSFKSELYNSKSAAYFSNERVDMLHLVPPTVKMVLDVGCSSGGFGKLIKQKFDCKVWGVEPTEAAVIACDHLDKVYRDYFHDGLDFQGVKFDLIIFNDVLEHLTDPWDALIFAKRYLSHSGAILASIPNVQCYTVVKELVRHGNWAYTSSGILDRTHLRFFTRKSIQEMFWDTGFDIEKLEGMHSVVPYSRLLRFLNLISPKRISPFTYTSYGVLAKPVQ